MHRVSNTRSGWPPHAYLLTNFPENPSGLLAVTYLGGLQVLPFMVDLEMLIVLFSSAGYVSW